MKGHVCSLVLYYHLSSSKKTCCRLPAFEPGFDGNKPCKQMSTKEHVHFLLYVLNTLQLLAAKVFKSTDLMSTLSWKGHTAVCWTSLGSKSQPWSGCQQTKGKKYSLHFSKHLWGGRLHDKPKECLLRRLFRWLYKVPSEQIIPAVQKPESHQNRWPIQWLISFLWTDSSSHFNHWILFFSKWVIFGVRVTTVPIKIMEYIGLWMAVLIFLFLSA